MKNVQSSTMRICIHFNTATLMTPNARYSAAITAVGKFHSGDQSWQLKENNRISSLLLLTRKVSAAPYCLSLRVPQKEGEIITRSMGNYVRANYWRRWWVKTGDTWLQKFTLLRMGFVRIAIWNRYYLTMYFGHEFERTITFSNKLCGSAYTIESGSVVLCLLSASLSIKVAKAPIKKYCHAIVILHYFALGLELKFW